MKSELKTAFIELFEKLEGWFHSIIQNLPNLLVAILVMIAAFYLARVVNKWGTRLASKRIAQDSIAQLIGRVSAIVVVLLGLFLALGTLDLSKTLNTLLAGAGISGLVIGLALQGTLSNLVGGIILSFRKKIEIGNWIETMGFSGEVVDISLNSLVLKQFDNTMVIIPNKKIVENPLKNYSITQRMRIALECGVGYESDLDKVEKVVKEAISTVYQQHNGTEIEVYFKDFGSSSITFVCRYWVDARDAKNRLDAKSAGIRAIKKSFKENNITIPFPIRTLEFNNALQMDSVRSEEMALQEA